MIGISLGDITGIGPEVTLKALVAEGPRDDARYLLIGDSRHVRQLNEKFGLKLPLQDFSAPDAPGRFFLFNPLTEALSDNLVEGSPAAARAAVAWLKAGAERCLRQELAALVTAPVSKAAIIRAGQAFIGQTEFLSELAGTNRTVMMLLGQDDRGRWLRVALATTHLPLKRVSENLTRGKVELAIELAAQSCRQLGLPRARVAVCGLNPHAGEGGELGDEEQKIITPAVQAQRQKKRRCGRPSQRGRIILSGL